MLKINRPPFFITQVIKGQYTDQRGRPRRTIKSTNQEIFFDTSSRLWVVGLLEYIMLGFPKY